MGIRDGSIGMVLRVRFITYKLNISIMSITKIYIKRLFKRLVGRSPLGNGEAEWVYLYLGETGMLSDVAKVNPGACKDEIRHARNSFYRHLLDDDKAMDAMLNGEVVLPPNQ